MKKFILLLAFVTILLAACQKNQETEPDNYLIFGTETFIPKSGVIETSHWYANEENRTTFHISIFDKAISKQSYETIIKTNGEDLTGFMGTNYLSVSLDSAYENFDYRTEGENCFELSWDFPGYIITNFDPESEEGLNELYTGKFCITSKNKYFEVEFEGKSKNEKNVSLYYLGELFEITSYD